MSGFGQKIGYVHKQCHMCGEHYNGYSSHKCPLELSDAMNKLANAAQAWLNQWVEPPRTKIDYELYDSIIEHARSANADAHRKEFAKEITKLSKTNFKFSNITKCAKCGGLVGLIKRSGRGGAVKREQCCCKVK